MPHYESVYWYVQETIPAHTQFNSYENSVTGANLTTTIMHFFLPSVITKQGAPTLCEPILFSIWVANMRNKGQSPKKYKPAIYYNTIDI